MVNPTETEAGNTEWVLGEKEVEGWNNNLLVRVRQNMC